MGLKEIAVSGATLIPADNPPIASGGQFTIISQPDPDVSFTNNVYITEINFIVSGLTFTGGYTQSAPVSARIEATAEDVKVKNQPVMRKDDTSETITIVGVLGNQSKDFDITVKISNAGQSDVKGS